MAKLIEDIKEIVKDNNGGVSSSFLIIKLMEKGYKNKDIVNTIHDGLDLGIIQFGNKLNIELGDIKDIPSWLN